MKTSCKKELPLISYTPTLLLSLTLSASVFAQTSNAPLDNNKNTSNSVIETIVVTASREAQQLDQVSRSLELIDAKQLQLSQHQHIQQVLSQVPGINFHRNSGQEYLAAIRSPVLTGAGACGEFLMLENDIPLRPIGPMSSR